MAKRYINTVALWKQTSLGTQGTAGTITSDPIDLRDINRQGNISMSYKLALAGTFNTCGSTIFSYLTCPVYDGVYFAAGTFGTFGNAATQGNLAIASPALSPFIKINAASGTSAPVVVTAELHVQ